MCVAESSLFVPGTRGKIARVLKTVHVPLNHPCLSLLRAATLTVIPALPDWPKVFEGFFLTSVIGFIAILLFHSYARYGCRFRCVRLRPATFAVQRYLHRMEKEKSETMRRDKNKQETKAHQ